MGVQGWTRYLADESWLPKHQSFQTYDYCCACTTLWRSRGALEDDPLFASRIVTLAKGGTVYIDGNGLVFYLLDVAYGRHFSDVIGKSKVGREIRGGRDRGCSCPLSTRLTPEQILRILPMWLPLSLVEEVTKEYVEALQKHGMNVIVYWDGSARHVVKQQTDRQRQSRICDEWDNLRQYCLHGMLPNQKVCRWKNHLPKPRLFIAQVQHTLQFTCTNVTIRFCREESDSVIAKAARGDPTSYILGNDSDFCFFPDVNYVPFNTLDASSSSQITGCVIRRDTLAEAIGLDEPLMVELAIFCGNDYLVDPSVAELNWYANSMRDCITFLSGKPSNYRITSLSEDIEHILLFVRTLYSLGSLTEFLFDEHGDDKDLSFKKRSNSHAMDDETVTSEREMIARPDIPDDLDLTCAEVDILRDQSVKDAVLRCLGEYVDQCIIAEKPCVLTKEHLEVYGSMDINESLPGLSFQWRPAWDDVRAEYLISKVIDSSLRLSLKSPLVRFCSPSTLFDPIGLHGRIRLARSSSTNLPLNGSIVEAASPGPKIEEPEVPLKLPVDDYEEEILSTISQNRVTIIQGETGCGKSSRIPVMLLNAPPPDESYREVKLFISQPRRIAAKALVERLRSVEPELRDCFALRMGHGVREYENFRTRAWFVTAGYLVRLLAGRPDRFRDISHLIIDEVHERSVETDLLCLLCRRLLKTNDRIRLVLMSATLAAELYRQYFGIPVPPLKVGARRFPVDEVYLEDLASVLVLPTKIKKDVDSLREEYKKLRCRDPPSTFQMEKLYQVVSHVATVVASPSSSVLVFVPGMNDIVAITEMIEQQYMPGVRFTCFPIHSDIPFEDQLDVFKPAAGDEIKVIIATNAAESSVTLPDVDNVICLGLCKQIVYNESSHRQMLTPTWISRASATQRAGRTGRLRPGTVYRMYTKVNFQQDMGDFEPGEMSRIPLDNVILMLRGMLADEPVTEVLLDALEPPNISTIDRSFASLHRNHFISSPDDKCEITMLGAFVSALGIDLALGSLIGLGIQLGVAAEAVQLSAVLTFPKTPWIMSNPLVHEPQEYNEMTRKTYASRCDFDAGLFSEPLSIMNLLWDFERIGENSRNNWSWKKSLSLPRVRRMFGVCKNLRVRVAGFLEIDPDVLKPAAPPRLMPHAKVTVLRALQAWVFHETLVQCEASSFIRGHSSENVTVDFKPRSAFVTEDDLDQILCRTRHPYVLSQPGRVNQDGTFEMPDNNRFEFENVEERFLSFMMEWQINVLYFSGESGCWLYVKQDVTEMTQSISFLDKLERDHFVAKISMRSYQGTRRGIHERACGRWAMGVLENGGEGQNSVSLCKYHVSIDAAKYKKVSSALVRNVIGFAVGGESTSRALICEVSDKRKRNFSLKLLGVSDRVPETDIRDLFGASAVMASKFAIVRGTQSITFPVSPVANASDDSSLSRPLVRVIPEGARVLTVVASGRRREHVVRLNSARDGDDNDPCSVDIFPDPKQTKLASRWKRMSTDNPVYVNENSVPATALPLQGNETMYCVAANSLEIRGGGLKVEGLTLLPPGRLFILLTRLSFGLFNKENRKDGSLVDKCLLWLMHGFPGKKKEAPVEWWKDKIEAAIAFHYSADDCGETLVCFPQVVCSLVNVFDGVDGYKSQVWDVDKDPLVPENLKLWKHNYLVGKREPLEQVERQLMEQSTVADISRNTPLVPRVPDSAVLTIVDAASETNHPPVNRNGASASAPRTGRPESAGKARPVLKRATQRTPRRIARSLDWKSVSPVILQGLEAALATDLAPDQNILGSELHSTNLLSLIVSHARQSLGQQQVVVTLDDWNVAVVGNNRYFWVEFGNRGLAWMRPALGVTIPEIEACIPPPFVSSLPLRQLRKDLVVCEDLVVAFRVAASIWLERQFGGDCHWYCQDDVPSMIDRLVKRCQE